MFDLSDCLASLHAPFNPGCLMYEQTRSSTARLMVRKIQYVLLRHLQPPLVPHQSMSMDLLPGSSVSWLGPSITAGFSFTLAAILLSQFTPDTGLRPPPHLCWPLLWISLDLIGTVVAPISWTPFRLSLYKLLSRSRRVDVTIRR